MYWLISLLQYDTVKQQYYYINNVKEADYYMPHFPPYLEDVKKPVAK